MVIASNDLYHASSLNLYRHPTTTTAFVRPKAHSWILNTGGMPFHLVFRRQLGVSALTTTTFLQACCTAAASKLVLVLDPSVPHTTKRVERDACNVQHTEGDCVQHEAQQNGCNPSEYSHYGGRQGAVVHGAQKHGVVQQAAHRSCADHHRKEIQGAAGSQALCCKC